MPKSQTLDPSELRKSGFIKFNDIPVNIYDKPIEKERGVFSDGDFLRDKSNTWYIKNTRRKNPNA